MKNYFLACNRSHAYLQYAYHISAEFIIDCLQTLGGVDHTTYYPILKPDLKIVSVQNAVILSKIIFLLAKVRMHIYNMLITYVQSFKLIA